VIKIGAGIGAGILLSDRLHYGDGFGAGEIGHLTVVEGGRQCICGNYGCLETVASTQAIVQRLQELAEYEWISFADGARLEAHEINWEFVLKAFGAGDETVTELVKEAGRYLGISIANLISILNVRRIVISGSYVDFGDTFLRAVSEEVRRRALALMTTETQIVYSTLGSYNVILGAVALLLSNEMGLP
jgi:predicted NBD/HSP70 family sugar kinase